MVLEPLNTAVQVTFRTTAAGLTGRLCLAGHPPALIRRGDGRVQEVGTCGNLLGVVDPVRLADIRFRMAPGDARGKPLTVPIAARSWKAVRWPTLGGLFQHS